MRNVCRHVCLRGELDAQAAEDEQEDDLPEASRSVPSLRRNDLCNALRQRWIDEQGEIVSDVLPGRHGCVVWNLGDLEIELCLQPNDQELLH